ncbi:Nuclear pore complex protein NUP50A [Striga hermonthica]|uniref:Nuclear pore complex protein NUP50A n=1 Tax=Striga hermonthica TaxID=68872 RepID=A0A9N7RP84_STRHE|nr:Nuclear pore complex protein NUP50A [Striga hermonthica]
MGDAESFQPSKKRAAGVQLTRDNPELDEENDNASGLEAGSTFKKASEEVLATRRIVKVRRQQTTSSSAPSAPAPTSSNPFAAIRLVPPPSSTEQADELKTESKAEDPKGEKYNADEEKADVSSDKADKQSEGEADDGLKADPSNADKDESDGTSKTPVEGEAENDAVSNDEENEVVASNDVKDCENDENKKENGDENAKKNTEATPFSSFQQLSSGQNAFSGLAGTGFSNTSFSFGLLSKDGGTNSLFSGFSSSNTETPSLFGNSSVANAVSQKEDSKFPPMQEVSVETGEENENAVFTADSILFEYIDGGWKERGKGELKVNVSTSGTGKARLVMRARGNYRLILNASLFPDMKLTNMDKKGVTFACVNSAAEGKDGLSTIALKFRDVLIAEDFKAAVMEHKGSKSSDVVGLKTPENSPKAE